MKKVLSFLAAIVLLGAFATQAYAYDGSVTLTGGQTIYYNYNVNGSHNITITYPGSSSSSPWQNGGVFYSKPTGVLVIPDSISHNGVKRRVASIGEYAFQDCYGLTSVIIPNGVTNINNSAFYGCTGLTSVTIGSGVTSIGNYAFQNCSGLTSVAIPNSVTAIGAAAFYNCSGLTSVTIPNNVTSIGNHAFYNCTGLTSVIFNADSCISAGSSINPAFAGCSNLTSITFGINVKRIPSYLCYGCSGLTSVTIPNSVTSIGDYAFRNCSGLTSVTIPNSVTSIGDYAFYNCSGLTSVTIPNSVTSMGNYAFYNCSGLTTVTIGSGVTSIGNYAFYGCSSLTSVTIPNSVTSIGSNAFSGCSGLTSVTIGSSVTAIGDGAFYNCSGLTSVTIPNSVTSIGNYAFQNCSALTSVTIGSGVTTISQQAFSNCSSLTTVTIPNSVTSIGNSAFNGCTGLTSVIFNADNCFSAGGNNYLVFDGCSNLTTITFGNNVTHIPEYLCKGCSSLTTVTIGSGVTSIGYRAFYGCSGLDTVYMMPATPPSILSSTFSGNASGRVFILAGCAYDNYYTTVSSNPWYTYSNYLRHPLYNINVTVQSSNTAHGTANVVLGPSNRIVRCDSTVVVQATANSNYHFDHWSNGSTANPDTLALTGDITITAYFIGLTVTSSDNTRGSATHTKIGDHLERITATPNTGYHFDHWSNGSTANPATITLTGDSTVTAYFIGLTVTSSDNTRGSATHTKIGDHLERITATPNTGYHFDHWSNGSTANPATITLTGDSTVTAYFERNSYNLTVNVNNTSLGTVATPDGTSALYQDTLMVVATPVEHYHVASWQGQGIVATSAHKDTVWVKMLNNYTLTCNFAIDTHTVAATASDIARGSVSGGGNYAYGTPCTVEATAYSGYTFQSWSNGVTANPYTFAVLEDVELTAIFVSPGEQTYTVTVSVNDPAMGSATVNGNATASVMSGTEVTLVATPNAGYHFVRWNDNNTEATRTITVTSNMSFTAYFEADGGTEGIEEIDASNIKVYAADGRIVVEGTTDEVRVYDMMGRMITHSSGLTATSPNLGEEQMVFNVPTSGVYLIKVGILPAKKVVVMKR